MKARILLVAFAATLFVMPLLRNEVFTLRDHAEYFQPLRWYTAEQLKHAHLPLWNPYNASGEPWLANPQTGVFYPPAWIFLLLPFPAAYMLYLFAHLALAGIAAHLLFTKRGSPAAALLGATSFIFAGPVLSLLDVSNNLTTFAWLPLVIALGIEDSERPRFRDAAVIALSFLAGEPFFAAAGAAIYAILRLRQRRFRVLAITAAGSFGLCAIQLLPFLELLAGSDRRAGIPRAELLHDSVPLSEWLWLFWSPWVRESAYDPAHAQHFIPLLYIGIGSIVALAGAAVAVRRDAASRPAIIGWTLLLVTCIIVGAGDRISVVGDALAHMPVTLFRYPARMIPLGTLAVIALAVEGWTFIVRRYPTFAMPRITALLVLMLVVDLAPRAWPLLHSAPLRTDRVPYPLAIGRMSKFFRLADSSPHGTRADWISGYLNLYERRFDVASPAPVIRERYARFYEDRLHRGDLSAANGASVGFLLARGVLRPPMIPVASSGDVVANANPGALPMAYVECSGRVKGANILVFREGEAWLQVIAPAPGIAVLTQQDDASWHVTVDGIERPKVVVNGLFRGVEVGAGKHDVVWTYRPYALYAGGLITLAALVAYALAYRARRAR